MNKKPLISVIVCTKSRIGTLRGTLESIFNQTLKNYEVIVVLSSRSEDNSNDFLVGLKSEGLIKLVINDGNRINARNLGLSLAQGSYVCFVDDDDTILNNKLEVQANYLVNHPEVDVVGCTTMLDFGSAIANTMVEMNPVDVLRGLESGEDIDTIINFQSCLFKKSIFDKYYKDKKPFDDLFIAGGEGQFLMYDMIVNHGVHFANTPNTIYIYRVGLAPNSLSANVDPVFYNEHIYGKSWDEKKDFVRKFDLLFGDKEKFEKFAKELNKEEEKPKKKRGRKKKEEIKNDEPINVEVPKRKRGRPRKNNIEKG